MLVNNPDIRRHQPEKKKSKRKACIGHEGASRSIASSVPLLSNTQLKQAQITFLTRVQESSE